MHPGQSVVHRFVLEPMDNIKKIFVTYRQRGRFILEKVVTSLSTEDDETYVEIYLDQFETLKFQDGKDAWVQLNILFEKDGIEYRAVSNPIDISVGVQFCRKTIGDYERASTLDDFFILADED